MELAPHPSLSGIPRHLRKKIFRYVGLVRNRPIELVDERCPKDCHSPYHSQLRGHSSPLKSPSLACLRDDPHLIPLPIGLLRVCSQIKREAEDILYGENSFYINCIVPDASTVIQRQVNLSKMKRLLILIDGHRGVWLEGFPDPPCGWSKICAILATHLRSEHTDLHIEFHERSMDIIEETVLAPMIAKGIPRLRNIKLSKYVRTWLLSQGGQSEFRSIEPFANALTERGKTADNPFALGDLPTELQELIISYTGIVRSRNIHLDGYRLIQRCAGLERWDCNECRDTCYTTHCDCSILHTFVWPRGVYHNAGYRINELAQDVFFRRNSFEFSCPRVTFPCSFPTDWAHLSMIRNLTLTEFNIEDFKIAACTKACKQVVELVETYLTHPGLRVTFVFHYGLRDIGGHSSSKNYPDTSREVEIVEHSKLKHARVVLAAIEETVAPIVVFSR